MARHVVLPGPADFDAWRREARRLLADSVLPDAAIWRVDDVGDASGDLFALVDSDPPVAQPRPAGSASVPRAFIALGQDVVCHSDTERFAILYRLLWRLMRERHLLHDAADPDVQRANVLAKAVRRDKHKMTAFVRFREVPTSDGSRWVAWFEPQHHIVEATAPFFVRRFASMRWSILTPRACAHWDGENLSFSAGASRHDAPADDAAEDAWRVYFASIFNPARLNVSAMQREMPKKYWKNMPETELIPDLVRRAQRRTQDMLENPPTLPRMTRLDREADLAKPRDGTTQVLAPVDTLAALNTHLDSCRRCPLWRDATQAIAGAGPHNADIMLVGEQPGDQEDLRGLPFVGPAGKLLDEALAAASVPRSALYVTNAVKHFKFEPRGKRRLHKKPNASEIETCRWWLADEIRLVKPKLVVALGATAASSLLQRSVKIAAERGRPIEMDGGTSVLITVHPSYLLRLPDARTAASERDRFIADLKIARNIAQDLGASLAA